MIKTYPNERILSEALLSIYPRVSPPTEFLHTLMDYFDYDNAAGEGNAWKKALKQWITDEAGLIVEDDDTWTDYRIIDQGKYTFALLRYS